MKALQLIVMKALQALQLIVMKALQALQLLSSFEVFCQALFSLQWLCNISVELSDFPDNIETA